jgi:pyruvate dehydrogenase (quinone)/pyruvate oxidase
VEDPKECGDAVEQFLRAPGPALLEAVVDPFEPPLPAKITMEQARHFAESLARGQPNRVEIAWSVLEGKVKEMI